MPRCHGWGCRPPLIASHIHIGHIYIVFAPFKDICGHMSAPSHCYTNTTGLILALLLGQTLNITLLSGNDAMMSWQGCRPPLIASHHILIVHIHSDVGPIHDVRGYMSVSSPPVTPPRQGQILAILGDCQVKMMAWWHGHDVIVEAVDHLWLHLIYIWVGKLATCWWHVGPTAKCRHILPTCPCRGNTKLIPTQHFLCRWLPTFTQFSLSTRATYPEILVRTGM